MQEHFELLIIGIVAVSISRPWSVWLRLSRAKERVARASAQTVPLRPVHPLRWRPFCFGQMKILYLVKKAFIRRVRGVQSRACESTCYRFDAVRGPVRLYAPGVRRCDAVGFGLCVRVREYATVYVRSDI